MKLVAYWITRSSASGRLEMEDNILHRLRDRALRVRKTITLIVSKYGKNNGADCEEHVFINRDAHGTSRVAYCSKGLDFTGLVPCVGSIRIKVTLYPHASKSVRPNPYR